MSSNYQLETDLKEAAAMANHLEDYVRGDQLYGKAGNSFFSSMPSLTVGALLMRLRRLDALRGQLKGRGEKQLEQTVEAWTDVREEWTHHYEQKMLREAHSRIDAMKAFFQECSKNMSQCAAIYRPELLRRTIVQELLREMDAMNTEKDDALDRDIKAADSKLRTFLRPDTFQWSEMLQPIYPQNEFWWLYQKPPQMDD